MSVAYASRGAARRSAYAPPPVSVWQRPAEWLAMPTVLPTEQKVVMLCAVYETPQRSRPAFTFTGAVSIDWGDGQPAQLVASGVQVNKQLNWSDYASSPLTADGARQAIVTITPQAGQTLTSFALNRHSSHTGAAYMSPYLDICISLPSCTSLTMSLANASLGHDMYERCRVLSHSCTSLAAVFRNVPRLRYVEVPVTGVTNLSTTFDQCFNLIEVVLPGSMTAVTSIASTFTGCSALRTITGTFNLSSCTSAGQAFSGCGALTVPPLTNTGSVLDWSSAFVGCNQLTSITLDTTAATLMTSMFSGCVRLTTVNLSNTANVTNTSNMFNACWSLKVGPTMNTAAVTNAATMFQTCVSLTDVPAYDLRACTNVTSMFAACTALRVVGAIQFSGSLVTTTNLFQNGGTALEQFRATGITRGFVLPNPNQLTGTELNTVYTNLGTAFGAQTITVTGSFGTATDTPSIATAKGWTVTGS